MADFWSNISGGKLHTGSWLGLPDLGITEKIADWRNVPRDPVTGGSQAFGGYTQPDIMTQLQQTPRPTSDVLGTSTDTTTPGPTPGPTPGQAPPEGQRDDGRSIEDMISEAYGPALGVLTDIEGSLRTGQETALGGIEKKFTKGGERIGREQTELETALTEQGRQLGESARSAYADARRAYNNLIQQGLSRFGAGSSTGPAVQELVSQEYLRSRGKMGQQEVAGQQQIAQEQTKLGNYITQKKDDLGTWRDDAIAKINENFTNSMNEINSRRADIEGNKTRDKIAALQNAVNQAEEVRNADRTYRLGLAQFAVEQMQEFADRAFTPEEISSVVNQMMGQELTGFGQRTAQTTSPFRLPTTPLSREEEELLRLQTGGQA